MKSIFCQAGLSLILSVVVAAASAQSARPETFRHEIKPGKIEEECRALKAGAQVTYRYVASAPVAFNVHFHKGSTVEYPVKVESSARETAIFTASSSEDYCWMWTNTSSSVVTIEGSLAAHP